MGAIHWSRDVRVPLRECDYQKPIKARSFPFILDSPEDELSLALAGQVVLMVPYWRRFKLWRDHRAPDSAYAEMRRLLLEYGYSEKDFECADFVDVVELIAEGHYKKSTDELRSLMGGTWYEYRQCLLETVGQWILDPKVLYYWRRQIDKLRQAYTEYLESGKKGESPNPIGGRDPRPLKFPEHLPVIYAGIASLHDRFNNLQIFTPELEEISTILDGEERLISMPTFFPGACKACYGREALPVDLWMIRKFIEIIRNDLQSKGLLGPEKANFKPTKKTSGNGAKKKRGPKRKYSLDEDKKLYNDWERARDSGVRKVDFCEDKNMTAVDLDRCLARVRKVKSG